MARKIYSVLAAVAASALTTNAAASDEKSIHHSACVGITDLARTNSAYFSSYLENQHASYTQTFMCPILRDNLTSDVANIRGFLYDSSATREITCTIAAYDEDGDYSDSYLWDSAAVSVTGDVTFNLSSVLPLAANNGYYVVWCDLPPGSRIYGFRWSED